MSTDQFERVGLSRIDEPAITTGDNCHVAQSAERNVGDRRAEPLLIDHLLNGSHPSIVANRLNRNSSKLAGATRFGVKPTEPGLT